MLIPAFKQAGVKFRSIASSGGVSGVYAGRKYGFEETTTDTDQLFADSDTNTVVITTRHDTHARFVLQALRAGKHVFVEKPLCLTLAELEEIGRAYGQVVGPPSELREVTNRGEGVAPAGERGVVARPILMVGFNRRFSPFVQRMKTLLGSVQAPKVFVMTVNAGEISPEHWTQDRSIGGGRIIGEACHFVDLLRFLAGAPVTGVQASRIGAAPGLAVRDDKVTFTLTFEDGSFGTVHYLANGHRSFPKERLEVFAGGRILQLDNFRRLRAYGWPGFRGMRRWRQDKGNRA